MVYINLYLAIGDQANTAAFTCGCGPRVLLYPTLSTLFLHPILPKAILPFSYESLLQSFEF